MKLDESQPKLLTEEELDREFLDIPRYYVSAERHIRSHIQALTNDLEKQKKALADIQEYIDISERISVSHIYRIAELAK